MNILDIAKTLDTARLTGKSISPIRDIDGLNEISDAYRIQEANTLKRLENGHRLVGKKIGLTSFAVQKQLGVDQPDYGSLTNDMEVLNGQALIMDTLIQPKAEVEIAFVLGDDLDHDQLTILDIINAVDYALPAIEIVDSRIEGWNIKILDTIADNASSSHYVLGHTPKTLDEFDMIQCQMSMHKNDTLVSTGVGSACLGSPLNAVMWLAKIMLEHGTPLMAGDLVLSGALGPMTNIVKGDRLSAQIDGLGSVSFYCE